MSFGFQILGKISQFLANLGGLVWVKTYTSRVEIVELCRVYLSLLFLLGAIILEYIIDKFALN